MADTSLLPGLPGIVCVLTSRWISVLLPMGAMAEWWIFWRLRTGCDLWRARGAISSVLALRLPQGLERELILTVTWIVVVFSDLAQGLACGLLPGRPRRNQRRMSRATAVKMLDCASFRLRTGAKQGGRR